MSRRCGNFPHDQIFFCERKIMNHIKTIMRYTLSLFILTFCTNQSSGNDLEIQKFINSYDKSNAIILDQISISASKVPTELKKTGSSVTIITKDDIQNSNEIFLIDYLNNIAGISVDQNGPPGMLSRITIRGSSAQYAKVLFDGIDITNTSAPQATPYLAKFLLNNIERIEVLKGNQSSLYGSQAVGGVINLTSKKPNKDGLSNSFSAEYGSYSTSNLNYTINNRTENNDLSINFKRFETDGFSATDKTSEDDGYQNSNINFNTTQYINENFSIDFGGFNLVEKGEFDAFGPSDSSEYLFKEKANGIKLGGNLISNFNHSLDYSYYNSDRDNYGPNSWDNYKGKGKRKSYLYKASRKITDNYNFVGGIDLTKDEAVISSSNKSSDLTGLFVENIFDVNNNLTVTLGARQDSHSKFGDHSVYRSTFAFRNNGTTYRGSYGTGYRAPSLYELFAAIYGNENLKPETSQNIDIGFSTNIMATKMRLSGSIFNNTIKDRIAFSGGGYNQVTTKEERQGLEIDIDHEISDRYNSKFSFANITDSDGDHVRKIPKSKLTYTLNSNITDKLKNTSTLTYVTELKDTVMLPDYSLINTKFIYKLNNDYTMNFRIENLLDEQYQLVNKYATADRSFYLGIDGEF